MLILLLQCYGAWAFTAAMFAWMVSLLVRTALRMIDGAAAEPDVQHPAVPAMPDRAPRIHLGLAA